MNSRTLGWDIVGDHVVSTVRLAVDHGFGGTPKWYETMVFPQKDGEVARFTDLYCNRYTTEEEAQEGHSRVVSELAAGTLELYGDEQ